MSKFKEDINISSILLMIIQGFGHVYLLHHNSDSLEKFREYKTKVENQLGKKYKDTSIRLRWRVCGLMIPRLFDRALNSIITLYI